MSEEQAPYYLEPEVKTNSTHEHLFRVAMGSSGLVIRWCERCGTSFLLQQVNELIHKTTTYQWVEIQEASPMDAKDTHQTLTSELSLTNL